MRFILSLMMAASLWGQASMTQTALTYAVGQGDLTVVVDSATGIVSPGTGGQGRIYIYVDSEMMAVDNVSGTALRVLRGINGTVATAHNAAAVVYAGTADKFAAGVATGACTSTSWPVTPRITPSAGVVQTCSSGVWTSSTGGGGSGDVVGPASATDSRIALFDGTTGKLIKQASQGLPNGTIVGTSDTQTLTAKTLTVPVVTSYTVATLPAAGTAGRIAIVTDSSGGSCTSGGSSSVVICRDTGAAWAAVGGSSVTLTSTDGSISISGYDIQVNPTNTNAGIIGGTPIGGSAPTDGQVLTYSSANSRWQAAAAGGGTSFTTTDQGMWLTGWGVAGSGGVQGITALTSLTPRFSPFTLSSGLKITKLLFYVASGSAAGDARVAIFDSTCSTKVAESNTLTLPAAGNVASFTFASPPTLSAGYYYMGVLSDAAAIFGAANGAITDGFLMNSGAATAQVFHGASVGSLAFGSTCGTRTALTGFTNYTSAAYARP